MTKARDSGRRAGRAQRKAILNSETEAFIGKWRGDGAVSAKGDADHNDRLPEGQAYVTYYSEELQGLETRAAYCLTVTAKARVGVWCKRTPKGDIEVLRLSGRTATGFLGPQVYDFSSPPATGLAGTNLTAGRDLLPGRVIIWVAGTLKVNTHEPYPYVDNAGAQKVWLPGDGNSLNLAGNVPGSGLQRWVQIALHKDAASPTLAAFNGATQSSLEPMDLQGWAQIAIPKAYERLDAVILKYGDSSEATVTEARWQFARNWGATAADGAAVVYADDAVSNPPTQAELATAFGNPWDVGAAFIGLLDDGGAGTHTYLVTSDTCQFHVVPLAVPASDLATAALVRQGTVLEADSGDGLNVYEPFAFYDSDPQLLTSLTHVFKMWYSNGWGSPALCYAESPDGETWTRYPGNPIITGFYRSAVVKHEGTYYLYAAIFGHARIDVWSSSDGVNFTSLATSVITTGSGWKSSDVANMHVWVEGATWYMLYEAKGTNWAIGLATASAPEGPWTDYVSNPVIAESGKARGGPHVAKIGSTYWMLCHGNLAGSGSLPTDLMRYHSTDLMTWVSDGLFLARTTADEGPSPSSVGQLADPSFLIRNGVLMVWHAASSDGGSETAGQHIKLVAGAATLLDPDYPAPIEQVQRVIVQVTDDTLDEVIFRIDDATGAVEYSRDDGATWVAIGNSGTVTSVGLTAPSEFTVSGSPVTGSGTLAIAKANQAANTVFAGPVAGGAAQPAFRALVAADLAGVSLSGGADHLHGLARWAADGTTTAFELPDIAEYVELVFDDGAAVDPLNVSLSDDRTQVVFSAAPTAAHVLQATYVIARI